MFSMCSPTCNRKKENGARIEVVSMLLVLKRCIGVQFQKGERIEVEILLRGR